MNKSYIVDTNTIISNINCLDILRNGEENEVYISYHVLLELDNLKKNSQIGHIAQQAIKAIRKNKNVKILKNEASNSKWSDIVDIKILEEIKSSKIEDPILVTNDILFQILAEKEGVRTQPFFESLPFKSESEKYTGFALEEENIPNSFFYNDNTVYMTKSNTTFPINHLNTPWKIRPRDVYQNLALQLMLDSTIDVVTVQSPAGKGKSYLALATALYLTFQLKQYEKIYVFKPPIEIGDTLGYLPGSISEKIAPYTIPISFLVRKLTKDRPVNGLYNVKKEGYLEYNPDMFEILPINYLRGMTLENCVVIAEEVQNLSRQEGRAFLSRMGENTKLIAIGDTNQVDNRFLNSYNNLLNWMVKLFKGKENYGHITLEGECSRGPICDMVLESGL